MGQSIVTLPGVLIVTGSRIDPLLVQVPLHRHEVKTKRK